MREVAESPLFDLPHPLEIYEKFVRVPLILTMRASGCLTKAQREIIHWQTLSNWQEHGKCIDVDCELYIYVRNFGR